MGLCGVSLLVGLNMRGLVLWLAAVTGLVCPACSQDQQGELRIEGFAQDKCLLEDPFVVSLDFVSFDDCDDILFLRMQRGGRLASVSDGVALQIEGLEQFRKDLEAGPVEVPLPDGTIRLAPYLNESCADSFASFQAQAGTLRIEALEPKDGGLLELSATFEIVDARTGAIVAASATLEMSATLTVEAPHKLYTTCPN